MRQKENKRDPLAYFETSKSSIMSVNPKERQFDILRFLGRGTFGEVHHVRRKSDRAEFALKKSNVSLLPPAQRTLEAATWGRLIHPNIVRLHDYWLGTDNEHLFLLMDLVVTEVKMDWYRIP